MTSPTVLPAERFWRASARHLAWRHNAARWLQFFLPCLIGAALVAAVAMLILRDLRGRTEWVWPALAGVLLLAAAGCAVAMRGRVLSLPRALVRLEETGRLHNRLTAAHAGIGPWPTPQPVADPAHWRWSRLLPPGALSLVVLGLSTWLPLPASSEHDVPHEQPLAWSEVQSWIDNLARAKVADPTALENLDNQLNELRQQPPEQWYQQSSLEAGDNLRQQTEQALRSMQQDLQKAGQVLEQTQNLHGQQPKIDQLKKMENTMQQALAGLQMGNLPLNQELTKQLKDFKPGQMAQLTPEQLERLRQRVQDSQQVCQNCVGTKLSANQKAGDENKGRNGGPGGGGESRPLSFQDETNLHSQKVEDLQSENHDDALPADLAGITTGQHEPNKNEAGPVSGGEIAGPGQGGDAVWRNTVLPRERTVLQNFFK
jgi:hypothetical protein